MIKRHCLIIIILAWSGAASAGITGKINGRLTDSETKQSIPGVNVLLEGTGLGAVSDINGQYTILNIPVGTYTIRASMLGYTTLRMENVRVSMDLTTKVDFKMFTEALQVSDVITIVAQRPMIQKDEVATKHYISSDEIDLQPIDSFQAIAQNQAGVVGNHFRGGRSGEVLVLVDGIPVKDPAGFYSENLANFTTSVPEYGIQEMEVSLGGFSAEYGNVQSGVLNLAMKEGTNRYSGKVRFSSTNFGNDKVNTQLLRNIYEVNLNGPEPISHFGLPLLGIRLPGTLLWSLSAEVNDQNRGYFLNQMSFDQTYQGKLTYRITPKLRLTLGGLYNKVDWDQYLFEASKYGPAPDYPVNEYKFTENDTLYHYIYVKNPTQYPQGIVTPEQGSFENENYHQMQTFYVAGMQEYLNNYSKKSDMTYLIWTHTLSARTFYEIRLQDFFTNSHYASADVDDRDHDGNRKEDLVWDITQSGPHPIYRDRENNYWWVRGDDPYYRDQSSWTRSVKGDFIRILALRGIPRGWWTRSAKGDFVSQITDNHLLKTGFEFYLHRTKVENVSWTLGEVRKDIWDEDSYDLGIYAQDKLEFAGIIALIGLRYDLFNPNGIEGNVYYPQNFSNPYASLNDDYMPILIDPRKAKLKQQLSPRIGISHPITDRDILHFTYGHFFQRPDGYFLYRNLKYLGLTSKGNYIGNPNLNPEKTVSYEFGIEHQFSNEIKATITGYYKDISNLMDQKKYIGSVINSEMWLFTNADYGNVKGLEFTFQKRIGRFGGGSINYTYSVAKGRSSDPWGGYGSFTDAKRMNILNYDQTHTVHANITMRTPTKLGKGTFWLKLLANWQMNVQFGYGSGLPYSSFGIGKVNDKRLPWTATTDIKLVRTIPVKKIAFDLFIDVFNLFDRQNVDWIGSSQYYELTGDPSVVNKEDVTGAYIRNPQAFSDSRQVRFGLAVQF